MIKLQGIKKPNGTSWQKFYSAGARGIA